MYPLHLIHFALCCRCRYHTVNALDLHWVNCKWPLLVHNHNVYTLITNQALS